MLGTSDLAVAAAAASVPGIKLNDGNVIPQIGLGLLRIENDDVAPVVKSALAAGYRHIDGAAGYNTTSGSEHMPWRYAEPPYTSMPSYRMTGIRFAIGGIGAGAGRQRRRPMSTMPPAMASSTTSPLTATRPWRTGHAGSAGHHAGRAALPSCRYPTRWAQSARSAYPAPSACLARSAPSALPWPSR